MNLDDESHLSAYLDDELDPADRLAVEWSIESSPPLADRLRSIALAREFVAGLDRPTIPRDLAPALEARIASKRPRVRLRSFARPALALGAFSGFSAVAASLIFALIRLYQPLHETPERPVVVAVQNEPGQAPRTHIVGPSAPAPITAPAPFSGARPGLVRLVLPEPRSPLDPPALAQLPGESAERADRRVISGILGRSHVRRIVIVTDVIDASERVKALIAQGGRETPEFGRISIRQEIVIDPDHAEAAEVFAVPIDERGRSSFVDRLRKSFPDLTEEGQSSPELVTQLTEVGQVAILRGLEAAPLGDPPGNFHAFIAKSEETEKAPFLFENDRDPLDPGRPVKRGSIKRLQSRRLTAARGRWMLARSSWVRPTSNGKPLPNPASGSRCSSG